MPPPKASAAAPQRPRQTQFEIRVKTTPPGHRFKTGNSGDRVIGCKRRDLPTEAVLQKWRTARDFERHGGPKDPSSFRSRFGKPE